MLPDKELEPELLALAPELKEAVGEADVVELALRVVLAVPLPLPEGVSVPLLVGVPLGL